METQLKKGFLEYCVLASLVKKDSYGYQIIKDTSQCIHISESTLYPILKRLESNDYVETYSVEHNGRLRKYFKITKLGRERIHEFLESWNEVETIYHFIREESSDEKE